jgi:hypothetical protein
MIGRATLFIALFLFLFAAGQPALYAQTQLTSVLKITDTALPDMLAKKTVVFYEPAFKTDELKSIQFGFQRIGIDAVGYFQADKVVAGRDAARVHADYLVSREISFIAFLSKSDGNFVFTITAFNGNMSFVTPQQPAWQRSNRKLDDLLVTIYRDSWLSQKKLNFLINDQPETEIPIVMIAGRRTELFPIDLKTDNIAIPKLADTTAVSQIMALFNEIYPYPTRVKVAVDPVVEKDLRRQGFSFVLRYVYCRGKAARELLGYDVSKNESAYGSLAYHNGTPQVKSISVDVPIYKFYIKHIESGNVFLGTKWDADEDMLQALRNYIQGFKTEFKLN